MSSRLDSRWGGSPLVGTGISPAESAGLCLAHQKIFKRSMNYPELSKRPFHPMAAKDAKDLIEELFSSMGKYVKLIKEETAKK